MITKKGSVGPRVTEIQELLDQHGFWTYHTITDFYGSITEDAVRNFQEAKGLNIDGKVGPNTWAELTNIKSVNVDNINPLYTTTNIEDHDDPEEEMILENLVETAPASIKISKLIELIETTELTRNVKRVVFHCTATPQTATVSAIQKYWKTKLGWRNPGYHIIIKPNGEWTMLLDFNRISNGVAGKNSTSINISYIGGINENGEAEDNRTEDQKIVLETIYFAFKKKYPNIDFNGHYEFSSKTCPSFNVQSWIQSIEK